MTQTESQLALHLPEKFVLVEEMLQIFVIAEWNYKLKLHNHLM